MEPHMIVRPLGFDLSQPYGPAERHVGEWLLKVSPKSFEYDYPKSVGYDCRIALTPLESTKNTVHVFAFRVSGLVYEYGWNAVRLHFGQGERIVELDSQTWATDTTCVVTCVVEDKQVLLFVESGPNPDPLPRLNDTSQPVLKDDKGVVYRHSLALDPNGSVPSVRFSAMGNNQVTIEPPWATRAYKAYVSCSYSRGYVYACTRV